MITTDFTSRLFYFLKELFNKHKFDYVLSVERKATAVIRAFLDLGKENNINLDWKQIISSDALEFLPPGYLNDKHVLVFNEMIHRGQNTKKAIDSLLMNSPKVKKIETAAFIIHEDFYRFDYWKELPISPEPDFAADRSLSDVLYCNKRDQLVTLLKNKGALLLDTEHLESPFSLTMPFRRFAEILNTFGEPIEYEEDELGIFPGITIQHPVIEDLERLYALLPSGTDLETNIPNKVRLVRRGPSEFVFIPIWYPMIPLDSIEPYLSRTNIPQYIRPALSKCPKHALPNLVFHLASLQAGLELIRSIWAGLAPYIGKGVEPEIVDDPTGTGSTLGHLRALYPLLDFRALNHSLKSAISTYKEVATVKRIHKLRKWDVRKQRPNTVNWVDADTRKEFCLKVLLEILENRRKFSLEEDWQDDETNNITSFQSCPISWKEFWETGKSLGIKDTILTILMDTAIDNAIINTGEMSIEKENRIFIIRSYKPDSELAERTLERISSGGVEIGTSTF